MTRKQIIQSFKDSFGGDLEYITYVRLNGKTTTRCAFVDYLDSLRRDGVITEKQQFETTASDKELFDVHIDL